MMQSDRMLSQALWRLEDRVDELAGDYAELAQAARADAVTLSSNALWWVLGAVAVLAVIMLLATVIVGRRRQAYSFEGAEDYGDPSHGDEYEVRDLDFAAAGEDYAEVRIADAGEDDLPVEEAEVLFSDEAEIIQFDDTTGDAPIEAAEDIPLGDDPVDETLDDNVKRGLFGLFARKKPTEEALETMTDTTPLPLDDADLPTNDDDITEAEPLFGAEEEVIFEEDVTIEDDLAELVEEEPVLAEEPAVFAREEEEDAEATRRRYAMAATAAGGSRLAFSGISSDDT